MSGKLLGGVTEVLNVGAGAVRHVAWFVSYHMGGSAHDDDRASGAPGPT